MEDCIQYSLKTRNQPLLDAALACRTGWTDLPLNVFMHKSRDDDDNRFQFFNAPMELFLCSNELSTNIRPNIVKRSPTKVETV